MESVIPADLPQSVLDAADVSAVTQLILTERESRDLGRWARLGACYFPDSRVRISWIDGTGAEFVEGSIDMARRGVLARHRMAPILVRLNGERAVASASAIIDIPFHLGGVDAVLSSHARFLYRAERREGRWGPGAISGEVGTGSPSEIATTWGLRRFRRRLCPRRDHHPDPGPGPAHRARGRRPLPRVLPHALLAPDAPGLQGEPRPRRRGPPRDR